MQPFIKTLSPPGAFPFSYSICTLVTRTDEYESMVSSFLKAGFSQDSCEYLCIDNTVSNVCDAYQGLNLFLRKAQGKYIIICHQDVLINKDTRTDLENRLLELDRKDLTWGLCGNAGAAGPNTVVYHVSYPDDLHMDKGNFPVKVSSLDENFLLVKNTAMLSISSDLSGFHLYATDLALNAELKGFSAYAIAFNLTHKSRGNIDKNFNLIKKQLQKKYCRFFRSRWIQTPSTIIYLSGSFSGRLHGNRISLFFSRMANGLKKRLQ